jgi:hypothetical protein
LDVGLNGRSSQFLPRSKSPLGIQFLVFNLASSKTSTMVHSVIEKIRNNDIDILALKEAPEDYFEEVDEFVQALIGNTSIDTVMFTDDFLGCAYGKDRAVLVEAISKLPKLQSVTLSQSLLRLPALTTLLKNAKGLKVLTLKEMVLQGLPQDIDALESALYQHPSMKDFSMMDCTSPVEGVDLEKVARAGAAARGAGTNPALDVGESRKPDNAIAA